MARLFALAMILPLLPLDQALGKEIQLSLPVRCQIGETCVIQHYVDHDPGPGADDYRCGSMTYDKHNGTDFRLLTLAAQKAGVDVLAAASGRVLRVRDGMADVSIRAAGAHSVEDRECGNGLVVSHGNGWETQYCHLAQGSITVRPGVEVRAGDPLGRIGLSGKTEFPHLHFTVLHEGKGIDPFAYGAAPEACGGGRSLWQPAIQATLGYKAGEALNTGFASGPVSMADVEAATGQPPGREAPAVVAFVRAIGLRAGDEQRLVLTGPDGRPLAERTDKLDRNKAQTLMFVGRKRPEAGWPRGAYSAAYSVTRDGRTVVERRFDLTL